MSSKITIGDALESLGITSYVLRGQPTSSSEFNSMFSKITGANSDGIGIESTDPSDFGTTWTDVKAKYDELVAAEPMEELRKVRNKKLAETDWWVLPDRTATDEQTAYRQALRDITDTYSSLDTVVWPTKPE